MSDPYIVEPEDDPADVKPNTRVVPDLHPAVFKNIDGHAADPIVRNMKEATAEAYASISDFVDRLQQAKADPLNSPLRAQVKVAGYVEKRQAEISKALDHARSTAVRHIEKLNATMQAPVKLPEDPAKMALHAEIREHLKKSLKKTGERAAFVKKAMAEGDNDTIIAALSGPPYLSGLSPTERQALEIEYRKARFPDEAAQLARLTQAVDRLENMGALYIREIGKVVDWQAVEAAKQRSAA